MSRPSRQTIKFKICDTPIEITSIASDEPESYILIDNQMVGTFTHESATLTDQDLLNDYFDEGSNAMWALCNHIIYTF
jgi:hypothetical protein